MNETAVRYQGLIQALRIQGAVCDHMGSPFSSVILAAAAEDVSLGGPTADLMTRWADRETRFLIADAVALRLLGALHDLALSGDDLALAAAYPTSGRPGSPRAAWSAALVAMATHGERLARFLDHEPQTNEVRRSACLLGGFLTIAAETGQPMRLFEVGASAGLNQLWDRYAYRLGDGVSWGDPAAAVQIPAAWRGPPPPLDASVVVNSRAACDRKPVDLKDLKARRRLRAYVWADQTDRLERLDAAVGMAQQAGTRVEAEDAVAWARRHVSPEAGAVTILFHSVFWQYMPPESQTALAAAIVDIGARASAVAPFAWLRMEPPPDNMTVMEVRLTLWPGGEERRLAAVHPHGAWVEWAQSPSGLPR